MKASRLLISVLFIVALFSNCKDDPIGEESEFEPYKINNFLITSETTAEFVGSTDKKAQKNITEESQDSVFISSPDNRLLELEKESKREGYFSITYIDSTINTVLSDSLGLATMNIDFNIPGVYGPYDHRIYLYEAGSETSLTSNYLRMKVDVYYGCIEYDLIDGDEVIEFKINYNNGNLYRVYIFDAKGLENTVEEITCSKSG